MEAAFSIEALLEALEKPEAALLLWGLYSRLIAGCLVVALLPFVTQLVPLSGKRGMTPVLPALRAAWRDFGPAAVW
jgi:hypothetical protein